MHDMILGAAPARCVQISTPCLRDFLREICDSITLFNHRGAASPCCSTRALQTTSSACAGCIPFAYCNPTLCTVSAVLLEGVRSSSIAVPQMSSGSLCCLRFSDVSVFCPSCVRGLLHTPPPCTPQRCASSFVGGALEAAQWQGGGGAPGCQHRRTRLWRHNI